ncbi:MAG: O-antigen ligase family protein [Gloeotrichia echinulata IR180]
MKIKEHLLHKIESGVLVIFLILSMELSLFPYREIVNLGIYLVLLIMTALQWKRIAYFATEDKTLIMLVAWASVSVFWSGFLDDTLLSLFRASRTTLFGAYLAARYTLRDQMRLLSSAILIAAFISIVVCILIPSYGIATTNNESVWVGIYSHKQNLGRTMALGCTIFVVDILSKDNKRWFILSLLVMPISLILLSQSRSSLILMVLSIAILSLYKIAKLQSLSQILVTLIIILIIGSISYIIIDNLEFILVDILDKDVELNGRTPIWMLALEKIKERFWIGYGYSAFWQSDAGKYITNNTWLKFSNNPPKGWNSHNGFIEMTLQLGIIGLGITIINLLSLIFKSAKLLILTLTVESMWMLEVVVFTIVNNTSSRMTFLSDNLYWVIYVSVTLTCSIEYSRISKNRQAIK